jgi:hypothetical protein
MNASGDLLKHPASAAGTATSLSASGPNVLAAAATITFGGIGGVAAAAVANFAASGLLEEPGKRTPKKPRV